MSDSEWLDGILWSCRILAAAHLQLSANDELLEADRIERWNAPWARNLRRKAAKKISRARCLAANIYDGQVLDENGIVC